MDFLVVIRSALHTSLLQAQKTGRITPNDYNIAMEICSNVVYNSILDRFEETSEVSDDVAPFVVTMGTPDYPPLAVDSFGYAIKPADYVRRVQAGNKVYVSTGCGTAAERKYRKVVFLPIDTFKTAMQSTLYKPTAKRIIACMENDKIRFAPAGLFDNVEFTYIKKAVAPFYDYNLSASGLEVFLPKGSFHDGTNLPAGTPSRTEPILFNTTTLYPFYQDLLKYFAIPVEASVQLQTLNLSA